MNFLETEFFNNAIYLWLLAAVSVLAIFLIFSLTQRWIIQHIVSKSENTKNGFHAFLGAVAVQTRGYFILAAGLYIASIIVNLPTGLENLLRVVFLTVFWIQVGFWGTTLINFWINRRVRQELERDNTSATTLSGLGLVARVILWSILVLIILENATGIQVNTLIASLGVTGIAVALAVQNILGDLFASLSITLDRPFVIGDFVIVGEFSGTVEHIGLKSTRIRSLSGEQLIFSNSDLLNSRIRNFKRMDRRRVIFFLDLTYQTPPEKLEQIPIVIREIITDYPQVTFDRAHFKEFQASSLRFEVVYFIESPDYLIFMDTQQDINLKIMRHFAEEGIEFAYPTQMVFMKESQGNGRIGMIER